MPAPDNDTSVFRTYGLSEVQLSDLLKVHRSANHGAAIVQVAEIRKEALDVIADEPPERHANIRGWPTSDDPFEQKARRKEVAICIAEAARHMPWKTD
ncbi:MAG: hypothetical protein SynsKO_28610 [Synoicihabitans sp.]